MTSDRLFTLIQNAGSIALMGHVSPDMDAIGSCLGAMHILRQGAFSAEVFFEDEVPQSLRFIDGAHLIQKPEQAEKVYDLAIAIDVASHDRLGSCAAIFDGAKNRFVLDHHKSNDFCCEKIVDAGSAASAELIALLVREAGICPGKEAAMCLYAGLSADTGNFSFESVTARSLSMASMLVDCGAQPSFITENLFRTSTASHVRLLGRALDKLKLHAGNRIALICLSDSDRIETGAQDGDYDGIINFALEIEGVQAAIMVTERPKGIRGSLRTKPSIDASAIAALFGGGGHARAAGMSFDGMALAEARDAVLLAIEGQL